MLIDLIWLLHVVYMSQNFTVCLISMYSYHVSTDKTPQVLHRISTSDFCCCNTRYLSRTIGGGVGGFDLIPRGDQRMNVCTVWLSLFLTYFTWASAYGMVLPMFKRSLSFLVNPLKTYPEECFTLSSKYFSTQSSWQSRLTITVTEGV